MLAILRFLRGYIRVYLWGYSPERFMNLCNNHGIELWDVELSDEGYEFYMYASAFTACRDFFRKTKTRAVIRQKLGLPFLLFRYRKRKLFFIGLAACFAALFFATRFLWAFEINGNRQFTEDMFRNFLIAENIEYGMPIRDLDIDAFEKKLRESFDYITWASAKIEGTRLSVSIKENDAAVRNPDTQLQTGDLCATVSGNVVHMITRAGSPMVKVGDTVQKGDVLISGMIPILNDDETLRACHKTRADGEVIIESVLSYEDVLMLSYEQKIYHDDKLRHPVLGFGSHEFVFGKKPSGAQYEMLSARKQIRLLENLYLPVVYGYNEYVSYETAACRYGKKEAKDILAGRFFRFYATLEEKGVQIIKKDVKILYKKEKAVAKGTLTIRENAVSLTPITDYPKENLFE